MRRLLLSLLLAPVSLLLHQVAVAQQLTSDLVVQRTLRTSGVVTPAEITADQDDYAPTGHAAAFALRLSSDAPRTLTGLAGGAAGRWVLLANVGAEDIVLAHEDGGSNAANRFLLPGATYSLEPRTAIWLWYDATSTRWRLPVSGLDPGSLAAVAFSGDYDDLDNTPALDFMPAPTGTPAEGDIAIWDGSAWIRLARGTEGQVLTATSSTVEWDDASGGFANPMTTAEDLIVGGTAGAPERLAVGTDGQVLKVVGGAVAWGTDSTGSGALPDTPAEGDLAYYDGADWVSLAIGTTGQVLTVNGTADAPEWATGGGGGGGTLTLARFTALDNQPPAANYATFDTRNSIAVLDFDATTDEQAVFVGIIPEGADFTTGISVRLHWMATSATSGSVTWESSFERSNTDLDSDSFGTVKFATSSTNATSGIVTVTTIDHSGSEIDGVTAGDLFRLKISRDANGTNGTDDMTGDAELVAVEVRQR